MEVIAHDQAVASSPVSLLGQLLRYLGVAVVAAIVDTGSLWVLASQAHVPYTVAAAVGFTLGLLTNFFLARTFVFAGTRMRFWAELGSYAIIGVVGLMLTEVVLFMGIDVVGLPLLIAKAVALVIVFFWNFFARRYLIYGVVHARHHWSGPAADSTGKGVAISGMSRLRPSILKRAGGMPRKVFLGVLLSSFGLRLAVLLAASPIVARDTPGYLDLAKGIASWNLHGDWGLRTPVYPLFLLLSHSSPSVVAAVQTLLIGTGIALLAAWTTWVITKHELAAAVAGLIYGLNLMQIAMEVTVLPETLSTFLLMATFASIAWVALSAGRRGSFPVKYICLGTSAGLLCLTRPQYLYVPLVVLAFVVWQCRRRWAVLALVAVLSLGPVIGWSTFNYVRLGYFGPTTQAGFSLTNHTGAYIEDAPDRYAAIKEIYLTERAVRGGDQENVIWKVMGPMSEKTGLSYPELSRELTSMSLHLIRTHPVQYTKMTLKGIAGFWKGTGRNNPPLKLAAGGIAHAAWVMNKYLIIAVNALFLCFVLVFLFPRGRRRVGDGATQIVWGVGAIVVLGSCLVQAMVEYGASARLGMPAGPVIAVLVASFVSLRWFPHDRRPKTGRPLGGAQGGEPD